jgi:hypothetical protein
MATEAIDRRFRAVIEQFQPKQRRAIKIGGRIPQHTNLMAANRSERNQCLRITLGKGAEFEISL